MRYPFLLLSFLLLSATGFSQTKTFTIQEATSGKWGKFAPKNLEFVSWRGKTDSFTYVKGYKEMYLVTVNDTTPKLLMTLEDLSAAIKKFRPGIEDPGYFPYDYQWADDSVFWFSHDQQIFYCNAFGKNITYAIKTPAGAENFAIDVKAKTAAFTVENNLFFTNAANTTLPVTSDSDKGIVNGSGYVHRQEFGIDRGIWWSPSASHIAFYRKDETMVTDYPLVNTSERIASLNNIKYPMAGMKSEEVTLGIYNVANGVTSFIKTGEPAEQYLTAITWDPSGKAVYIGILNRGQDHLKMNRYDVATGNLTATLFEEKNPRYVEPEHPLMFLKTDPSQFIWQSERDGYNHLYLYTNTGKLVKQLTKGSWAVTEILGFDAKEENLFYISTEASPIERQVYSVNIKSGKITRHTKEAGTHHATLSSNGRYIVDQYSSMTVPNEVALIDTKTGSRTLLLKAENPYKDYQMPQAELVTITAADGVTQLHGRLIRPVTGSRNQKFPAIVYVYGGPHAQLVMNEWLGGTGLWDYYMAQRGYVMFTVDNRGSANRGFDFESVVHRQLGQQEMADQMKGVEYLRTLPMVDTSRMGVHGWSFGGFMTTSLMLNYPGVFKAAVAGGPVMDWKFYEIMYGERYMDTPQENPDGYEKTSPIRKVAALDGKLLIIHGAQDDVVVMQHSLEFVKAAIGAGKQVDFFAYPTHKHNVSGKDRVHLMQKITDYFDLHLRP